MKRFTSRWKTALVTSFLLVALVAAGGWVTRSTWLSWYYVRCLKQANEQDREGWIERVTDLDEDALARLVPCLEEDDERACANVGAALARLTEKWGVGEPRSVDLASSLAQSFPHMSFPGQQAVLRLTEAWLTADKLPGPGTIEAIGLMVQESVRSSSTEVRGTGYQVLNVLVRLDKAPGHISLYRELARKGLEEEDAALRAQAVSAALVPELELLEHLVPLLHDRSAEVRRSAMLAVGPATTILHDEDLLPWLNDDDAEVRQSCEAALRKRGIPNRSIRLARMITHPQHTVRLEAIMELMSRTDPDPTPWYQRLTHDTHPSVQVAALRAAQCRHVEPKPKNQQASFQHSSSDIEGGGMNGGLRDRIEEIARTDPSATVRQLATYYLSAQ
jgi:hypothetical protein